MVRGRLRLQPELQHQRRDGTFPADVDLLFTFTALSGQLGSAQGFDTLPHNWIIEWENIVDGATGQAGKARKFDTALVGRCFHSAH